MAAAPSPLQQSHLNNSDSEGSDSENEQQQPSTSTQQITTKLSELALIDEVQVDVQHLNPLSPEVISKQATINIGALNRSEGVAVLSRAKSTGGRMQSQQPFGRILYRLPMCENDCCDSVERVVACWHSAQRIATGGGVMRVQLSSPTNDYGAALVFMPFMS